MIYTDETVTLPFDSCLRRGDVFHRFRTFYIEHCETTLNCTQLVRGESRLYSLKYWSHPQREGRSFKWTRDSDIYGTLWNKRHVNWTETSPCKRFRSTRRRVKLEGRMNINNTSQEMDDQTVSTVIPKST